MHISAALQAARANKHYKKGGKEWTVEAEHLDYLLTGRVIVECDYPMVLVDLKQRLKRGTHLLVETFPDSNFLVISPY